MNERIKELAEQAGVLTDFGEDIKVGRWGIGGNYKQMQTFAELIIRECMRMCDVAAVGYEEHGDIKEANGCVLASKYIAEHFEVE